MKADNPFNPSKSSRISVSYHGLPKYLKSEAVKRAEAGLGLTLRDLMDGRAEFLLSEYQDFVGRTIVEVTRTSIA